MAAQSADAGAEDEADHFAGGAVEEGVGDLRGECSAAGVAHDVVQEAHGAVGGAVLVVDEAVGMAGVSLGDESGGGGQIVFAPGAQLEFAGQGGLRLIVKRRQVLNHEQAAIEGESGVGKDVYQSAGRMEQELRLDAVHLRGILQGFKEVAQKHALDFARGLRASVRGWAGVGGRKHRLGFDGEDIADDRLAFLVDAEGVAGDAPAVDSGVAGQHVVVEILHEQTRGGAVIPMETLAPNNGFGFQQGPEHRCAEVAQIEDFQGNARSHAYAFIPLRRQCPLGNFATSAKVLQPDIDGMEPVRFQRAPTR